MKVNLSSTPGNVHVEIVGKNMIIQRKPSGDTLIMAYSHTQGGHTVSIIVN
jgi:hypothetical protein